MTRYLLLGWLPDYIVPMISPISFIVAGILLEKKLVSRSSLFGNTIALNLFLLGNGNDVFSDSINLVLGIYANIGLFIGLAGIISYAKYEETPLVFYIIGIVYHSFIIAVIFIVILGIRLFH